MQYGIVLQAKVESLWLADGKSPHMSTRIDRLEATLAGLTGDRHAGLTRIADDRTPIYPRGATIHNTRHATVVAEDELAQIAAALGIPKIEPQWIGANIVFSGVKNLSTQSSSFFRLASPARSS